MSQHDATYQDLERVMSLCNLVSLTSYHPTYVCWLVRRAMPGEYEGDKLYKVNNLMRETDHSTLLGAWNRIKADQRAKTGDLLSDTFHASAYAALSLEVETAKKEGLFPGVSGIIADADMYCLDCARIIYGREQIQIVIDGSIQDGDQIVRIDYLDPRYPRGREDNPLSPILSSEEMEAYPICGKCWIALDTAYCDEPIAY